MDATIDGLDKPGFVPDQPGLTLPKGAWTDSRNVEFREGAVEKCRGYAQALGDLSVTAIWAQPVTDGANYFWVYGGNTVMYATDGATHAEITGDTSLNALDDLNYSGGPFHGYMVVNDGVGIPQSWVPSLANNLQSLTAWPADTAARVMRSFKDFIFAFRITTGGEYNSRLIRWSDRAAQSQLPFSWDFNDPNNQSGINELGQSDDQIVDGSRLRDSLIIHKENHTWAADYIGGGDVFGFREVFSEVGLLTEGCYLTFGARQLVWTTHDIVIHDGNSAESILDGVARRWLFNRINTTRYKRCFITADFRNRKAYFCFPEAGYDWPNLALVYNWQEGKLYPYELGGPKTFGSRGIIPGVAISIDSDEGTFDEATGTFDEETYNPFLTKSVLLDALAPRAYQGDTGESYNGEPMRAYAERESIPIAKDLLFMRKVLRIFPLIEGTPGDTMLFHVGVRDNQQASTQWIGPFPFTIGTDYKIDLLGYRVRGRLISLRVEYAGTNTFRLSSYKVEFENVGYR
jgi:hypothetical protein